MTTAEAVLRLAEPEGLSDCAALLSRLVRLEATALVRLQPAGDHVTLWAHPLGVVVRRQVRAQLAAGDRTVSAAQLLTEVEATAGTAVGLPPPKDQAWRVTLPPRAGWSGLDAVPVGVFRDLGDTAARVIRAAGDPAAAGEALLEQEALRVSNGAEEVTLPMRVVAVVNRMGFLGSEGRSADVVRVACTPAWTRLAARHGTVYRRRAGTGLFLA